MWTLPESLRAPGRRARILFPLACFCLCVTAPARATLFYFTASLDGAQVPTASTGTGSGTFTVDTVANTMSFNITFSGLGSAETAAHIHGPALPLVNAGIVFPLPAGSPKIGVWNYLQSQEADILANLMYVNIHSVVFPSGEIRGQITATGGSCGDGVVNGPETCDDNNTTPGDGCSDTCQIEQCFTCAGGPSVCSPITTCINSDGCCPIGCTIGNDNDCPPPIPAVTNKPSKAPVFVEFFVRSNNACTSPNGSHSHNAPLAFPACTPSSASPGGPSFGQNGLCEAVGVVLLSPLTKQATDVKLVGVCKDVRNNDDGTGTLANTGFSGQLQITSTIRTTDHFCDGALNNLCTLIDIPFPVPLPCGTVASPKLGKGVCVSKTRANVVVPGAVSPGHRASVGLSQLEIRGNGGANLVFESGIFLK